MTSIKPFDMELFDLTEIKLDFYTTAYNLLQIKLDKFEKIPSNKLGQS